MSFIINEKGFANNPPKSSPSAYQKYVDVIAKLEKEFTAGINFLDIGCGIGQAVARLSDTLNHGSQATGVDVSGYSIELAKQSGKGIFLQYGGSRLPFSDHHFDVVGSNNVLEHVNDPISFLSEANRVLKPNGYLIVACPNFLSISNGYHHHTKGIIQKINNILMIINKTFSDGYDFKKMSAIKRERFQPDDDACNVTNPLDIVKWAKRHKLETLYWSSQLEYKQGIVNLIDRSYLRLFLGACFFVFMKSNEKNP